MKRFAMILGVLALTGCSNVGFFRAAPVPAADGSDQVRPVARPDTGPPAPPSNARTIEQFDTTSPEDRAEAAAPAAVGEAALGTTIASLGDPARPGFWLETPLVRAETMGRVVLPDSGKSAQVTLIPIDGPATGGSRLSLAAMRLIEAPLTGLPEIQVFSGG